MRCVTEPLPVRALRWEHSGAGGADGVTLWWAPADGSTQDEYRVSYHEAGPSRDDSNTLSTAERRVTLRALLPGRNYSVAVSAVSRAVPSAPAVLALATRPLAPVLRAATPERGALRLEWRSDVNSRQDTYELRYRRRATPAAPEEPYVTVSHKIRPHL